MMPNASRSAPPATRPAVPTKLAPAASPNRLRTASCPSPYWTTRRSARAMNPPACSKCKPTGTPRTPPKIVPPTPRSKAARERSSNRSSRPLPPPPRPTPPRASTSTSKLRSSSPSQPSPQRSKLPTSPCPKGFTINPDAADGQTACSEAQANFESEGPAECPDQSKIGTFSIGTPALPERLEGSVYLGEPKPGDQYRLFMIASGFGMNIKLDRLGQTQPGDRPAHRRIPKPAPGTLRRLPAAPLFRRTGADGNPDVVHDLHSERRVLPLERDSARTEFKPDLRPRIRSPRQRMPRPRSVPSNQVWKPAPPTPPPTPLAPSASS